MISVLSNVAPKRTHDICQKFFDWRCKGRFTGVWLDAIPLISRIIQLKSNPIPVKAAIEYDGQGFGPLRLAWLEMEDAHKEVLET